jgi:hypothetical protein
MKINTKVIVHSKALYNAGRVGYFQFYGAGEKQNNATLTDEPTSVCDKSGNYFTVGRDEIKEL